MGWRAGHTCRVFDWWRFTVVFGSNFIADGSHRGPAIDVIFRQPAKSCATALYGPRNWKGIRYRRFSVPLPYVSFAKGWKYRRFGLLWVSNTMTNRYYKLFSTGRRG